MTRETADEGHRRDPPRREPRAELPSGAGTGRRPAREAVTVGRGRLVVRDVRDRRDHPADPVSARVRVAVGGPDHAAGRAADRRRCRRAVHPKPLWFAARCGSWHSAPSRSRRPTLSAAWSIRFFSAHAWSQSRWCALWSLSACGSADTHRRRRRSTYLGQVRARPTEYLFDETMVGGLSATQLRPADVRLYYVISDDRSAKNPARFYTARITLPGQQIEQRRVGVDATPLLDRTGKPFAPLSADAAPPVIPPDPEGIAFDGRRQQLYWSSEGERITDDPNHPCCSTRGCGSPPSTARSAASSRCRPCCRCRRGTHGPAAEPGAGGSDPDARAARYLCAGDGGSGLQRR